MENKFKYKLTELKPGDTKVEDGIQYRVSDIDPERGTVSWDVKYGADIGAVLGKLTNAMDILRKIQVNYPQDRFFTEIFNSIKSVRNKYRAYLRTNYPDEYDSIKLKKAYMKEDEEIDEISTSGAAGAYNTPLAFNPNKKSKGAPSVKYYYKLGWKLVPKKIKGSGLEVKKLF